MTIGFTFNFTKDQLQLLIPHNQYVAEWYDALCTILPEYGIDTPQRVAAFLAQCCHESGQFSVIVENLNYKAESLIKVFPKYFPTKELANQYAHNQEKIANRVYANRMGNGSESSGDGYRYRGKGLIQLTGKANYESFAKSIDMTLDEVTEYLDTFQGAVQSACHFWETNNLNQYADSGDFVTLTKRINGGVNGLADRKEYYVSASSILNA